MNTRARIATVCQHGRSFGNVAANREYVLGLLDSALPLKPDLVCLPEAFTTSGVRDSVAHAETVPGPTTDAAAALARKGNCYVVCPIVTRRDGPDGPAYISAVLLDRKGNVAGIYDKRHPVTSSHDYTILEGGVSPGLGDGIFDLDFGCIGIRICFDIGFPEDWELMARHGVRLVLWPSAYDGGTPLQTHAAFHQYYVVTSVHSERSRIIDPCGDVLAATDRLSNVIYRDINLDFAVCHYDFNYPIPDRIRTDYGDRVEVRSHYPGALFLLEPADPTVTVAELQSRYGFEDARQYFERHRVAYAAVKDGHCPPPQTAAHGNRPEYSKG